MRLLFLVDHLLESGGARVVLDLARRLDNGQVHSALFVLQPDVDGNVLDPDRSVTTIPGTRRRYQLRLAMPIGAVTLLRNARHFDVLISGSEIGYAVWLGYLVARLTRKRFVVFVQSPIQGSIERWVPRRVQFLTRWINAHADGAVAVSPPLVDGIVANGLAAGKVQTTTVGVDVDRLHALALAEVDPADLGRPLVVGIGRLSDEKGFDLLIRSHAQVMERGYPHTLAIVGDGPDRAELEQLVAQLGLRASVRFCGFISNPQPLLASADLFVLPSRREGMGGLVLAEALAHGVPIVAADCVTGPRELLRDGELGVLVPVADAAALATAIEQYLADPADLRRRALLGPARAREFDPDAAAHQFAQAIRTLVNRSRDVPERT